MRVRDAALSLDADDTDGAPPVSLVTVGPSYFETMQIPVLQGREFSVLVAVWLPTRRASRMDPMEALRHE